MMEFTFDHFIEEKLHSEEKDEAEVWRVDLPRSDQHEDVGCHLYIQKRYFPI